ncbi:MAG: ribosomal protein S18-alanine N-acetyltransferase, partial [Dehalococcoidia bacterium]|nr:ribosomal protein S18-alanine N-acetyltransferase [Dehalococcoidia bacterium]
SFSDKTSSEDTDCTLLGFVGLWFMSGEAHITGIAVEEASRGKGIGELLIIGSIELAMARDATVMSLEARVSNFVAQALYEKYGFLNVGIRKGYYTDNREDAVIMTTQPINDAAYRNKFNALKDAYRQRYGEIKMELP